MPKPRKKPYFVTLGLVVCMRSQLAYTCDSKTVPYTLAPLKAIVSLSAVSIPANIIPPGFVTHQALAMVTASPQGWRGSPKRPRPECSTELEKGN